MSHRNRVTYQSESVFVGENDQATPDLLTRVQNANYNFNITRTDVNQFGQVGRIDSLILEAPTVSLDLSYLLTDGQNEKLLDFVVENADLGADDDVPFYKNILLGPNNSAPKRNSDGSDAGGDPMSGKSYYILTVPDGQDSVGIDDQNSADNSLIKIGNAYINEWSMEVSVGALPTVSTSFEAANLEVTNSNGTHFGALPAIDLSAFKRLIDADSEQVILPSITEDNEYDGVGADQISALRPGDIAISLSSNSIPVDGINLEWDSANTWIKVTGDAKSDGTIEIRFSGNITIDIDGDPNNQKTESWYAVFEVAVTENDQVSTIGAAIASALNSSPASTSENIASALWNPDTNIFAVDNLDGTVSFTDGSILNAGDSLGTGNDTADLSGPVYAGNPVLNSGTQPGVIAKQLIGKPGATVEGAAHIQSFSLSIPFGRSPLQRIGTLFSFARPLDLPTNATFSVNALVSELNDGKLMDKLCQKDLQIHIVMREPVCPDIDNPDQGAKVIEFLLKDVELESESIGSSIGDNKTVDLTFNVGIHGAEDGTRGIFARFHDSEL